MDEFVEGLVVLVRVGEVDELEEDELVRVGEMELLDLEGTVRLMMVGVLVGDVFVRLASGVVLGRLDVAGVWVRLTFVLLFGRVTVLLGEVMEVAAALGLVLPSARDTVEEVGCVTAGYPVVGFTGRLGASVPVVVVVVVTGLDVVPPPPVL